MLVVFGYLKVNNQDLPPDRTYLLRNKPQKTHRCGTVPDLHRVPVEEFVVETLTKFSHN